MSPARRAFTIEPENFYGTGKTPGREWMVAMVHHRWSAASAEAVDEASRERRVAGRSVIKVMNNARSYDGYQKYTAEVAANYERDRQVEAHWWKEDGSSGTLQRQAGGAPSRHSGGHRPFLSALQAWRTRWSASTCPRTC